ncbi:MAG: SAM-dependent chlorinase/fluorinase [Syntrophorhabdus sp.]|nr:SAM-dependent chlorinase/fluorinase [Syntrophorhabdus sp.]
MGIITLLTDFGVKDPYVGVMKGIILGIDPGCRIVDMTHEVEPQDMREAAFLIDDYWRYFPPGTVHVAVVDPTVGSARRPLIVSAKGHHFVGPDNGVFTLLADNAPDIHVIENRNFMLSPVSSTFHGRDVFSPAAARLSRGYSPQAFGRKITDPVLLSDIHPVIEGRTLKGSVVRFDRFGNAITNIKGHALRYFAGEGPFEIRMGEHVFAAIGKTYCEGGLTCLEGSSGYLEFGVFKGDFRRETGTGKGDPVTVTLP